MDSDTDTAPEVTDAPRQFAAPRWVQPLARVVAGVGLGLIVAAVVLKGVFWLACVAFLLVGLAGMLTSGDLRPATLLRLLRRNTEPVGDAEDPDQTAPAGDYLNVSKPERLRLRVPDEPAEDPIAVVIRREADGGEAPKTPTLFLPRPTRGLTAIAVPRGIEIEVSAETIDTASVVCVTSIERSVSPDGEVHHTIAYKQNFSIIDESAMNVRFTLPHDVALSHDGIVWACEWLLEFVSAEGTTIECRLLEVS